MTRTLPNHLTELLRTCREFNTTETKTLAVLLNLSPTTVNAYFQRAAELLGSTDRFSTVQHAFRRGLLISLEDNLLINGNFMEGNQGHGPGNSLPWTNVMGWLPLRGGSPQWVMPEAEGSPGAIMMWGSKDTGEAIYQVLPPKHRTRPGCLYHFSAEYRFGPVKRDWPLVPRQPMFVDFVIRLSQSGLENYTSPDVPGKVVTIGRLHYAARPADSVITVPVVPATPELLESLRLRGGEHAVEQHFASMRAGGMSVWAWESGALEDWDADGEYTVLTIHPTNDLIVGTDGSNKDAPLELAWGQIRNVRFIEVKKED
ncbi:hypothetical protein [Armatimonas sp.]|uniref:hypothetical protein n=1 Tax=Armatimonas sp. TaxID=1872638 RepID=UPI00286D4CC5|nr:hypothetical protein [Armatimonas sp.]